MTSHRPLLAAVAGAVAAATAAATAILVAWALFPASAPSHEASVPAASASPRELRRRLRLFGNTLPEVDQPSLPFLGRVRAMAKMPEIVKRLGTAVNTDMFKINLLAVAGPENIRRVFNLSEVFHSANPARWHELIGHSSVSFVESEHRRIRNILNACVSKSSISASYVRLHELARAELDNIAKEGRPEIKQGRFPWSSSIETRGVLVLKFARRFTFNVISAFIAGSDPVHEAQLVACRSDLEDISDGMGDLILPQALPFSPFGNGMRARARVVVIVQGIIDNRRKRQDAGESFGDMLGNLMNGRLGNGELLSDSEICDNVIALLNAGYETTSSLLSTAVHYLTRVIQPNDRASLQDEIDGLNFDGDLPSEESLQSLPVLDAFMKETLRLKSPIRGAFRKTVKETEINATPIRQGTVVLAMVQTTMLDDALYPDPYAFDLARFLPGGPALSLPQYAFQPFGGGPRLCLGMQLAKLKFKVIMFQMLRHYCVEAGTAESLPGSFPFQRFLSSVYLTEREV